MPTLRGSDPIFGFTQHAGRLRGLRTGLGLCRACGTRFRTQIAKALKHRGFSLKASHLLSIFAIKSLESTLEIGGVGGQNLLKHRRPNSLTATPPAYSSAHTFISSSRASSDSLAARGCPEDTSPRAPQTPAETPQACSER